MRGREPCAGYNGPLFGNKRKGAAKARAPENNVTARQRIRTAAQILEKKAGREFSL